MNGLGFDEKAVLEILGLDEELREERVAALAEERLGGDEHPGVVAVQPDDALDRDLGLAAAAPAAGASTRGVA